MQDFSSIRAIFFDTTDTLYRNKAMEEEYPRQLILLISEERGTSITEAEELLRATMERLKPSLPHVTKVRAMQELGFTRDQTHAAFAKTDPHDFLSSDPELRTMLTILAKRFPLGIISNDRRNQMSRVFDALGLQESIFSHFVTDDIVEERKPQPEPFLKAIELSGFQAQECLYVGDSPTKDMRPAKELGMITILVKVDPTTEHLQHADAHIPDIKNIIDLLPL